MISAITSGSKGNWGLDRDRRARMGFDVTETRFGGPLSGERLLPSLLGLGLGCGGNISAENISGRS